MSVGTRIHFIKNIKHHSICMMELSHRGGRRRTIISNIIIILLAIIEQFNQEARRMSDEIETKKGAEAAFVQSLL